MGSTITCQEDCKNIQDNKILGTCPILNNTSIIFNGKGNILFCEENVRLNGSRLVFQGNNNLIYLSSNKHMYKLNVDIYNESVLFFGKNNYINGSINIILSERKHVIIGEEGLFSFDIWIRLADPHLIYSTETKERLNPSKSVFLGDHVWIGQHAMIFKGTHIGSGSIVGAMALATGVKIPSNTSWGGVPAKQIKDKIFWDGSCVHNYSIQATQKSMVKDTDIYVYDYEKDVTMDMNKLDEGLTKLENPESRLGYIQNKLVNGKSKNRFYIQDTDKNHRRNIFHKK